MEFWELTKKLGLILWREVSAIETDELFVDIGECLAGAVWNKQLQAGIASKDEVRNGIAPEYEAVVLDREYIYGLANEPDKAFEVLSNGLGHFLEIMLGKKGWAVPGARFAGSDAASDKAQSDTWNTPQNEEIQLIQIGLADALNWAARQELSGLKKKAERGELRHSFIKTSQNRLFQEIRSQNRRLGIVLMEESDPEGKTEEEIQDQIARANASRAPKEILDYEVEGEEGTSGSMLGLAGDRQGFEKWKDEQSEDEKQELVAQHLMKLVGKVKLTPRQELVARLFNMPDEDIADALQREFGKPVKPGAVRKLRYDLVKKLREADSQK